MKTTLLTVAAASLLLAAAAQAQKKKSPGGSTAQSDSTFSSDTKLVLIDAVVTDKNGVSIVDLTQKDFKVRDDGEQQTLTSFSYLAEGAPDDQKHDLVFLFDNTTVPQINQRYGRDAATKLIGLNAGPNRLMAVVEFGGTLRVTQNLTGDVDRLLQAVNGTTPSVGPANATPGLPAALSHLAEGMVNLPGHKSIILFSGGVSGSSDLMKNAIEECNRANVAVYPVGIGTGSPRGGQSNPFGTYRGKGAVPPTMVAAAQQADLGAQQSASDALSALAKGTGGFVIPVSTKLQDHLSMIAKEANQYYALGYLPANQSQPGACHTIKVETDRRGASVRARDSYCDVETPEIQAGTTTERDLESRLVANEKSTIQATMQTPFFYVAPNTARVDLALDIPGAAMKFARDKGKFTATLNAIGIAYLPDNGVAARFNGIAKVILDDQQQVDEFATRPYHFEKQFEMASGAFDLKVAFGSGAASFGAIETKLTIDPWDPSKFLLSGLALSQTTHPATVADPGEVDWSGSKVPLNAGGVQFIPAGTNRLQKSQEAFIYGEIYEPMPATAEVQLTLLNAKTGKSVSVKPETVPGASAVSFGIVLPTDELAPGRTPGRSTRGMPQVTTPRARSNSNWSPDYGPDP